MCLVWAVLPRWRLLERDHIVLTSCGGADAHCNWQLPHRHYPSEKTAKDGLRPNNGVR